MKTAVLVFRRPAEGKKRAVSKIWFYEVKNDGYDPHKIQGGGRPETLELSDIPALVEAWKEHKEAGFKSPPGVEAGTVLDPGTAEPRCWWASLKTVAANDYNLAASRYKPRVGEKVPDEDPVELIRDVMALEARIQEGLEKLLREIET